MCRTGEVRGSDSAQAPRGGSFPRPQMQFWVQKAKYDMGEGDAEKETDNDRQRESPGSYLTLPIMS